MSQRLQIAFSLLKLLCLYAWKSSWIELSLWRFFLFLRRKTYHCFPKLQSTAGRCFFVKNWENLELLGSTVFKIFSLFLLSRFLEDISMIFKMFTNQLNWLIVNNTTLKSNVFQFYPTWLLRQCFRSDLYRYQVKPASLMQHHCVLLQSLLTL